MKKQLLQLAVLLNVTVFAQPIFTNNKCHQVGDSSGLQWALLNQDFQGFKSQKGSNYTWNFSSQNWTNPTTKYTFKTKQESSPFNISFNVLNELAYVAFKRDVYYNYSSAMDTLYLVGLNPSSNDYFYNPPVPYLSFSLNFNDSVSNYRRQFANPNQPTTKTGSVTRSYKYDGYGTLQLPYATVNNVIRVKTHQIDSVGNSATVYEEIIWFRESDGIPVLRLLPYVASGYSNAYYASAASGTSSISEQYKIAFNIYPNPVSDELHIELENKNPYTIEIKNIFGETVQHAQNENIINTYNLASGIYILSVYQNNLRSQIKFTKQ